MFMFIENAIMHALHEKLENSTLALFGKFKKWSKILASVLKTCVYDVRSSKKNLGSIGGSLEEL